MDKHQHQEPEDLKEATKTIRDYWNMPRTYEFESEIVEVDQQWVRLSHSFFYPEGGGQPSDRGLLKIGDKTYRVEDVQEKVDHIWLLTPDHSLTEGDLVEGKIDAQRRETLSKNHSAQHLLSAAFWEELEYETTRALIDLRETELEFDKNPSFADIRKAVNAAETQIEEALPISSQFYSRDDLDSLAIRGGVEGNFEVYRIVEIGVYDRNPCGGTHVTNTKEIGNLVISRIDGKRIKFMTGRHAFQEVSQRMIDLHEINRILTSSMDTVVSNAEQVVQRKQYLEKQAIKYEQQITELSIRNTAYVERDEYRIKVLELKDIDRGQILHSLGDLDLNEVALVYNREGTFILTAGDEDNVSRIMKTLRDIGVKGGGSGNVIMGKLAGDSSQHNYLDIIHSSLSSS